MTGNGGFSHIQGELLFSYKAVDIVAMRDGISFEEARVKLLAEVDINPEWTASDKDKILQAEAVEIINGHPVLFGRMLLKGLVKMLFVPGEHTLIELVGFKIPKEGGPMGDLLRLTFKEYY